MLNKPSECQKWPFYPRFIILFSVYILSDFDVQNSKSKDLFFFYFPFLRAIHIKPQKNPKLIEQQTLYQKKIKKIHEDASFYQEQMVIKNINSLKDSWTGASLHHEQMVMKHCYKKEPSNKKIRRKPCNRSTFLHVS